MLSSAVSRRGEAKATSPGIRSLIGASSLIANKLYDPDGNLLGKVEEVVIDTRTGCVRHVVLALGGFLGLGRKRVAVPWSAIAPDADLRRCIVDTTQLQLMAVQIPVDDPWLERRMSKSTASAAASKSAPTYVAGLSLRSALRSR